MAKLNFANKSVFGKQEEKNFNIEINDNSVIDIPIELIDIGENIRDMTTDQELEELGQTIREYGQIEPCIVHQEGERYVIEMGSRRYKACKLEDIPTLKCIVRPKFQSEKERIIIQAIENDIIQVIYDDGTNSIYIRKGAGTEDISGDYNEYEQSCG